MKYTIILLFFSYTAWGQVDTLFIGNKKALLKRTKPYYTHQTGPVFLSSEYEDIFDKGKRIKIKYNEWSDTTDATVLDREGNVLRVKILMPCKFNGNDSFDLCRFVDTIFVNAKSLDELKPYIKVNGKKIYFCAAEIMALKKGIINEYISKMVFDGGIFQFWENNNEPTSEEIENRKATTYILKDLYYIRNKITYYLDREFIIIAK